MKEKLVEISRKLISRFNLAKNIIIDGKGKHFDPDIVDVFLEIEYTFRDIAEQFADNPVAEVASQFTR